MGQKEIIYLCMGSACHQFGVYDVLPTLQKLMVDHRLENEIVLKGAFCLGPCMDGIVLKVGDRMIVNINAQNIEQKFLEEVLPYFRPEQP